MGPSKQIALQHVAAVLQQKRGLCLCFHAFSDDIEAKITRQHDQRLGQIRPTGTGKHIFDKGLVDLDLAYWQSLQIGQAGIASPEIINRNSDSQGTYSLVGNIGYRRRFEE